jgi:hypothetical protein
MAELPSTATPLTLPEVAAELARAHLLERGKLPHRNLLALGVGIVALENANGKAILQHNYGNIAWVGQVPNWWTNPKAVAGQPSRFAAYKSHDEGARAWWRLMYRRYRPVLARGLAHDPRGAVKEQYRLGYVKNGQGAYERVVANRFESAESDYIPKSRALANFLGPVALVTGLAGAVALAKGWI